MKQRVLITGATGFLGSHIAECFVRSENWDVCATKRVSSDLYRVSEFSNKINWIDLNNENWKTEAIEFAPQVIINSAWCGVAAGGRNDWQTQISNISFQQELLDIALESGTKQFIGVGSQAEYGEFNEVVTEEYPTHPTTAYGSIKLASLEILKDFCHINNISWSWFRLFSVFGEYEGANWLIPATINNILKKDSMDFTAAEQQYSYMYIKDVAEIFFQCCCKTHPNGIYNISAKKTVKLRDIITYIQQQLNPNFKLNFGALPYRPNQSMHNQGDVTKLEKYILQVNESSIYPSLDKTINFYKNR